MACLCGRMASHGCRPQATLKEHLEEERKSTAGRESGVAELQQQLRSREEELQSLKDAHDEKTKVMEDAHSEAQQHKSKRLEAKNEIIVVSKTLQVGPPSSVPRVAANLCLCGASGGEGVERPASLSPSAQRHPPGKGASYVP